MACHKVKSKPELIRVVRVSNENVEVDTSGKKAGRGAYLCPAPECWEIGIKGRRLERALRITLTPDNRERLMKCEKDLWQGVVSGEGK
ncbi:MAG: YlxR family protein [Dehalococcoidales bacterium]|nr:YlxR family protein [Dehalococcoidales bacterium]